MLSHAPKNYVCPFCLIVKGDLHPKVEIKKSHLVYSGKRITAFISNRKWAANSGIIIIVPNKHYENIYTIPDRLLAEIGKFSKKIAVAMKKGYKCDGVSTRQHNEPAGNQDVWHFHSHVIPRYKNDNLYLNHKKKSTASFPERTKYAKLIKKFLDK